MLLLQQHTSPKNSFRVHPIISSEQHSDRDGEQENRSIFPATSPLVSFRNSKFYLFLISLCIFASFLLHDIRIIALSPSSDILIDTLLVACASCFAGDIAIRVKAEKGYCGSVFFWMDLGATVGLLVDITVIYEKVSIECFDRGIGRAKVVFRVARLSSGMARFLRSIRVHKSSPIPDFSHSRSRSHSRSDPSVISSIDLASRFNSLCERRNSEKYRLSAFIEGTDLNLQSTDLHMIRRHVHRRSTFLQLYSLQVEAATPLPAAPPADTVVYESEISRVVTYRIVAFLVLVAVCCSCAAVAHFFPDENQSVVYGLRLLEQSEAAPRWRDLQVEFVLFHSRSEELRALLELSLRGTVLWTREKHDLFRDVRNADVCRTVVGAYTATISKAKESQVCAVFDLCTSGIICLLITTACLKLNSDFRNILLFPLERMLQTAAQMAKNPLSFAKLSTKIDRTPDKKPEKCCESAKDYAEAEVQFMENAFRKIGAMLAVVYGTAGSEIISKTVKANAEFEPIAPGRTVVAVFCFAKIRHFDVLQDHLGLDLLSYVNLICTLVHHVCESHLGSVNRNLGDAFFLVWKLPSLPNNTVINPSSALVKSTVSLAVMFAVKAVEKSGESREVFHYQHSKKLLRQGLAFTNVLSFGLHAGWAYEGAIGSIYKIDATYVSPNVNLASRLETATGQYGVQIMVSGEVVECLENEVQSYMRHIDTVFLKGVQSPVSLYTFDLRDPGFSLTSTLPTKYSTELKRSKLSHAVNLDLISVSDMFTKSTAISMMRKSFGRRFFELFEEGRAKYAAGEWEGAREVLEGAELDVEDGPSKAILMFMKERAYKAPEGWQGVRKLLSK